MRTSTASLRRRIGSRGAHGGAAGFTLIEVLIVVVLIAITASLAVVSLRQDDRAVLREEAQRLADSFRFLQDEAIMTGAIIGWRGESQGYAYQRRTVDKQWVPLDADGGGAFVRRLPDAIRLVDVSVDGVSVDPALPILLTPSGMTPNARVVLTANRDRAIVEIGAVSRVVIENGS